MAAEGKISKLDNCSIDVIQSKEQKQESMKKNKWASGTCGTSSGMPNYAYHDSQKERGDRSRNICKNNGQKLLQFHLKTLTYTYKKLKEYQVACLKTKTKRKIVKQQWNTTHVRYCHNINSWSVIRNYGGNIVVGWHTQRAGRKKCQPRFLYLAKLCCKNEKLKHSQINTNEGIFCYHIFEKY